MNKNQKGFSAVEGLLILIIVGLIGFTGWYVWQAKQNADKTLNAAATTASNTPKTIKNSSQQIKYVDKQNGFSFVYEANNKPTISVIAEDALKLKNFGGDYLSYDTTKNQFVTTDYLNVSTAFQPTIKTGKTDIYVWDEGDAGTVSRTYIVHLNNQKILTVAYEYDLEIKDDSTGKIEEPGLTASEYNAQKAKDQQAIQTFKFI